MYIIFIVVFFRNNSTPTAQYEFTPLIKIQKIKQLANTPIFL